MYLTVVPAKSGISNIHYPRPHTFQSDALEIAVRKESQEKVLRVLGVCPGSNDLLPEGWRPGETLGLGTHDFKAFESSLGVNFASKAVSQEAMWGGRGSGLFERS